VRRLLLRSGTFVRAAKKYVKKNPAAAADIQSALELLSADALQSRLKAHKLKGNLEGSWACSAGYDLRIVFRFVLWESKEAILLETIGSHEEAY
jgi:addiction module RelE/StbE family toxin